jgi:hypothetical protein
MVIKAYNIQLPKILMYLGLHPPKHEKIHPFENFHFMKIGQWMNQNFIPKSKSCIDAWFLPKGRTNKQHCKDKSWRAPKSRGETHLRVSQSQVAESWTW